VSGLGAAPARLPLPEGTNGVVGAGVGTEAPPCTGAAEPDDVGAAATGGELDESVDAILLI